MFLTSIGLVLAVAAQASRADCDDRATAAAPRAPTAMAFADQLAGQFDPRLVSSPLWGPNAEAIGELQRDRRLGLEPEYWIAVVPGTSEQWGHHTAPPRELDPGGTLISDEFRSRLDRAFRLLAAGTTRFIAVSGGAVDPHRPDYNEAERAKRYLLDAYGPSWPGGRAALARRIMIDPLASTSIANIRNTDKLCIDLGIPRSLVVTTMPSGPGLGLPGPECGYQGWYYLHPTLSSFNHGARKSLGYVPGEFHWYEGRDTGDRRITALTHDITAVDQLDRDDYGP